MSGAVRARMPESLICSFTSSAILWAVSEARLVSRTSASVIRCGSNSSTFSSDCRTNSSDSVNGMPLSLLLVIGSQNESGFYFWSLRSLFRDAEQRDVCLIALAKFLGAIIFRMSYVIWLMAYGIVIKRSRPMTYIRGGAQYLRQILLRAGDGFG